jgi:hypothetical protein
MSHQALGRPALPGRLRPLRCSPVSKPAHRNCCQGIDFLMLRADADKFDMDDTNSEAVATNSR